MSEPSRSVIEFKNEGIASRAKRWSAIRDRIAPQGEAVDAKTLIDKTFTILRYRTYQSRYEAGRETVYWVVGVTDDGVLFNTTLGGVAVCDVLDAIDKMYRAYADAIADGDMVAQKDLEEIGADSPVTFTLRWVPAGTAGYYTVE
jgi:hypothetical protein